MNDYNYCYTYFEGKGLFKGNWDTYWWRKDYIFNGIYISD